MKKCGNCKNRCFTGWGGMMDFCYGYEISSTEAEEIENAKGCPKYAEGTPSCFENEYTPSATAGDYSPSNPWNAPGMSIRDFI